MRSRPAVIFVVAVSLVAPSVRAQVPDDMENYTAEVMYRLCLGTETEIRPEFQSLVCTFRLQGLVNIMIENCLSIEEGFSPAPLLTASLPPSRGALRQAFTNFMEENPAKWGLPWHVVAAMAASEAFPCEAKT